MTTEEDFQKQLDKHPKDSQTRLVFADWLQERNDPRAEGYRELGRLQRQPLMTVTAHPIPPYHFFTYLTTGKTVYAPKGSNTERFTLPWWWYQLILDNPNQMLYKVGPTEMLGWRTRREAENTAAKAYTTVTKLLQSRIAVRQVVRPTGPITATYRRMYGTTELQHTETNFQIIRTPNDNLRWKELTEPTDLPKIIIYTAFNNKAVTKTQLQKLVEIIKEKPPAPLRAEEVLNLTPQEKDYINQLAKAFPQ